MVKFENVKKREVKICFENEEIILHLMYSPIVNKFDIITNFIEKMSKFHGNDFDSWFLKFLKVKTTKELKVEIPKIKKYCDDYIDNLKIDFSKYIDRKKIKKTSIVFLEEDLENLIKLSSYLKIYSVRSQSMDLKFGDRDNKIIFSEFLSGKESVMSRVFDLCRSKTFSYGLSDSYMWVYLAQTLNKEISTYSIEIFNFIMNSIIVLCKEDMNPVVFLVTVIDSSIGFLFKGVYRNTFIFENSGNSVDYQNLTFNSLRTCISKDALSRLSAVSYDNMLLRLKERTTMYNLDFKSEEVNLRDRLNSVDFISPVSDFILIPLLSKILEIPYIMLKQDIQAKELALIGSYFRIITKSFFCNEYKTLFDLFDLYATSEPPKVTTFKIRQVDTLLNNLDSFLRCRTFEYPSKAICQIIGKIWKVSYYNILSGKQCKVFSNVEVDIIKFLCDFLSGKIDIERLRSKLLKEI